MLQEQDTLEAQREHSASELARLEKEAGETLGELHARTDAARANVEELTAMLAQAKQDHLVAELAELNTFNRYETQLAPHRAFLVKTAPTMLTAFLAELKGHQARLRNRQAQMPDLPDMHGELRKQAPILDARWQQHQILLEWHNLLHETSKQIAALLNEPVGVREAADIVVQKREAINKAYVSAMRAGVSLN